jgi:tetraacyldisaccharide 4'-kinase
MPWYAVFLIPFSLLYRWVTSVRNYLYDRGIKKSYSSPLPTLVVGNLSVGGTGKTPMVEFLVKNLLAHVDLAILSRGYGRRTKGFLEANAKSSTQEIGDEPHQVYKKFLGSVPVFVGEDRVEALKKIHQSGPALKLVVLDDAFQHRRLRPDFKILLTPYVLPFFRDYEMPAGRLRESRNGARRADVIVVTKSPPDLSETEKSEFRKRISAYTLKDTPVYFSSISYGAPIPLTDKTFSDRAAVFLVSGLADDRLFVHYCRNTFSVVGSLSFPDHYEYKASDARRLVEEVEKVTGSDVVILTTEKDAEKLKSLAQQGLLKEIPIFALPIEVNMTPIEKESLLSNVREKLNIK